MNSVAVIRWVLANLLGAVAIYLAVLNWHALVKRKTQPNGPTWIPLFGGLLGVAALLLEPTGTARRYWWIPLVLDAGSMPGFVVTGIYLLARRRNGHSGS